MKTSFANSPNTTNSITPHQRDGLRRNTKAWIFLVPLLTLNLIVIVIPAIFSLGLSFTEWSGLGSPEFVGLANFQALFQDDRFFRALSHNLIWTAIFLTIPVMVGLLGAFLLAGIRRGQMVFRMLFFLPYVVAGVVNAQLWRYLLHPRFGIGSWLADQGINVLDFSPFARTSTSLYAVAFVDGWRFWGFLVVVYLAAMVQVDTELYEVARLEGANRFRQFWHVTLPGIRSTLVFTLLMITIWSVPVFEYVYILTGGGPANSSEVMATYLYSTAFDRFDVGYAASMGIVMSVFAIIIISVFVFLRSRGWEI